jgi:hypothetical protein
LTGALAAVFLIMPMFSMTISALLYHTALVAARICVCCRDNIEALDMIDEAVRNPTGTNQHMAVTNVNRQRRPRGNSRATALRGLRDYRPELLREFWRESSRRIGR